MLVLGLLAALVAADQVRDTAVPSTIEIRFVGGPTSQLSASGVDDGVPTSLIIRATVAVSQNGEPVAGLPVLVSAGSGQPLCADDLVSDPAGIVQFTCGVDTGVMEQSVTVQACVSKTLTPCVDDRIRIVARDWVDANFRIDVATGLVGNPTDLDAAITGLAMGTADVAFQAWQRLRPSSAYRLSQWNMVPYAYQIQSQSSALQRTPAQGSGIGDFQSGVSFVARPYVRNPGGTSGPPRSHYRGDLYLRLDAGYNSRSGTVNFIDSIRRSGRGQYVNIGDGFESFDTTVSADVFTGNTGFMFILASLARPLEQRSSRTEQILASQTAGSITTTTVEIVQFAAERSDFSQVLFGGGRRHDTGDDSVRFWIGLQRLPLARVRDERLVVLRSTTAPERVLQREVRTDIDLPEASELILGFNGGTREHARMRVNFGMFFSHSKLQGPSFTLSLGMNVRIL